VRRVTNLVSRVKIRESALLGSVNLEEFREKTQAVVLGGTRPASGCTANVTATEPSMGWKKMTEDDPEARVPTDRQYYNNYTMNTPKEPSLRQALRRTDTFDKFHVSKDSKKYHNTLKPQTRRDQIITKHLKTISSGAGPYPNATEASRLTTDPTRALYKSPHNRETSILITKNQEQKPILRSENSTYRHQQTKKLDNPFFALTKPNFRAEAQTFDDQQATPRQDSLQSPTKVRRMETFGQINLKIDSDRNQPTDDSEEEDKMWSPLIKALEYKRSVSLKARESPVKTALATLVKTHRSPGEKRGSLFVSESTGEIK
jgi:hypothetical protein